MSNPASLDEMGWGIGTRIGLVYERTVPGWSEEREL